WVVNSIHRPPGSSIAPPRWDTSGRHASNRRVQLTKEIADARGGRSGRRRLPDLVARDHTFTSAVAKANDADGRLSRAHGGIVRLFSSAPHVATRNGTR